MKGRGGGDGVDFSHSAVMTRYSRERGEALDVVSRSGVLGRYAFLRGEGLRGTVPTYD